MKIFIIFALAIVAALAVDIPPEPFTINPPNNSTILPTTTSVPTTITTTTTTTVKTTTTTTVKTPITTTTTTTAKTPTTTPGSTTAAPTAPPKPKPKPKKPEVLNFTVTENNIKCIVVEMALMFTVPYATVNNTNTTAKVMVPREAKATGECGSINQTITISWLPTLNSSQMDNVTLVFHKNATHKQFMISSITVQLVQDNLNFPNSSSNESLYMMDKKAYFNTSLAMSYKCKREEYLNLTIANSNKIAMFVVSDLQLEAFRNSSTQEFSAAEYCEPFETSGIVPIAVGCSLAALIIIVLIVYLIGRRRSQARGYLSM